MYVNMIYSWFGGRKGARVAASTQSVRRQPALSVLAVPRAQRLHVWSVTGAVRAQSRGARVHLGHQLVRSVGGRIRYVISNDVMYSQEDRFLYIYLFLIIYESCYYCWSLLVTKDIVYLFIYYGNRQEARWRCPSATCCLSRRCRCSRRRGLQLVHFQFIAQISRTQACQSTG